MKILLIVLLLFPFYSEAQTPIPAYGMTKVENVWEPFSSDNYSINRIASWEMADGKQSGTEFIFFVSNITDDPNFRENLNLVIQNLEGNTIDLANFASISEDQIKSMLTNAKIVESKKINGDFYESHNIIFTGEQGIYKLKIEQRYIIHKSKAYVLTFTAQESVFDIFYNHVEKAMDSFNFPN